MKTIFKNYLICGLLLTNALTVVSGKEAAAPSPKDIAEGKKLYSSCIMCHGDTGHGNKTMNAPQIAGQEAWYLKRQLENFKAGIRGGNAKDVYGSQMKAMSMTLTTPEKINQVVAYIGTLKPAAKLPQTIKGDVAKGKVKFRLCATCHGQTGGGMKAMNGPKLTGLQDWYLVRQMQNFKGGLRGVHPKDVMGKQMAPMAATLATDEDIKNVAAYISSL